MKHWMTPLAALLCCLPTLARADSVSGWTSWNVKELTVGDFSTTTHAELRFPHFDELQYYRISQKFYYKLDDTWTAGLHATLEESKNAAGDWRYTWRIEPELNTAWSVGQARIKTRNRFEFRQKQGAAGQWQNRARQYTTLDWPVHLLPGLKTVGVGNELFYDLKLHEFSADWIQPLQLTFAPSKGVSTALYYQYQLTRAKDDSWHGAHVIGVSTTFTL